MLKPTQQQAEDAVRCLIAFIGDNPDRGGLVDTPARVLRAWQTTWGAGYNHAGPEELLRVFSDEEPHPGEAASTYDQMVVVSGIRFFSTCEHHMAPFFGTASVAYLPVSPASYTPRAAAWDALKERILPQRYSGGLVGLSKLARVVNHFAARLQVQERLTAQIADFLQTHVSGDVGVTLTATHLCMASRGVRQPDAGTTTSALRGRFMQPEVRQEFFQATRSYAQG